MSKKPLHPVFQVLNFVLHSNSLSFKLSPSEKLLLIILARHFGVKGIYPSITTLAREMQLSARGTIKILSKLEQKELILIDRQNGKSNHYEVVIPNNLSTTSEPQFTSEDVFTSEPQFTTPVNFQVQTSEPQFTQYNKDNKIQKKNREREPLSFNQKQKSKASPKNSQTFEPNDLNKVLAMELRLSIEQELNSFMHRHKGEKSQYEFERWLKNAYQYQKGQSRNNSTEARSPILDWGPGHPSYDSLHGVRNERTTDRNTANGNIGRTGVRKAEGYLF